MGTSPKAAWVSLVSAAQAFRWQFLVLVAAAALLTYIPFTDLPPLPDDYCQAELGERLTRSPGWIWSDPLYRTRFTSIVLTGATLQWLGFSPLAFNWTSVLLHAANAMLVYLMGAVRLIGWRVSLLAALVFAVLERHHEAVVWYAALPELLVFLFSITTLLLWLKWLEGGRGWLLAATLGAFFLALASKESGVVLSVVLPATAILLRRRRAEALAWGLFFLGAGVAYFGASWLGRSANQHYRDGTFALSGNFAIVLLRSAARAFWFWGLLALVALLAIRPRRLPRSLWLAAIWIPAALAPYSFLTYMGQIPSRHHYLAGFGVALIVSVALWRLRRTQLRRFALVLGLLFVLHNWVYLWTHKRGQFYGRAEAMERYLREAEYEMRHGRGLPPVSQTSNPWETKRALRYRLGIVVED
jgi:nitrogen fixation-related uncharacterized protein